MIKSYFKLAWRHMLKNKTNSLLNIIGLAAGLVCFAYIFLWVNHELSYDKFNLNYDRIVRLTGITKTETGILGSARSGAPVAEVLNDNYPEVENTVRFRMREEVVLHEGQQVLQPGILLTDPSFFDIFSYHLTRGDAATALNEPYSVILTASAAGKYFGHADPIGKSLTILMNDSTGRGAAYKVTGTMPDPPTNAHFTFTMLASMKSVEVANPSVLSAEGWDDAGFYTYLLLREGIDYEAFSDKITQLYKTYRGSRSEAGSEYFYQLQPLSDIYLRSHLQDEIGPTGIITQVHVFLTIGIFILLLAGINYTNLAIARSAGRAKEVSINIVVGAVKKQLILQYLSESVLTAKMALLFSLVLSFLLQPLFHQITEKDISLFSSPLLLLFLLGVTVFLGILAGIYPAFILSAFKPSGVLKGSFKSGSRGVMLRKTFVITQFVGTLILLIGLVVIYSQMSFIKHKDLGYNKEVLVFLKQNGNIDVVNGYNGFKNELEASTLISGVTTSGGFTFESLNRGFTETVDDRGNPLQVRTSTLGVGADYLDVHGIRLMAGKDFTPYAPGDTTQQLIRQVMLNQMAVKKFGWENPAAAIGKPFKMGEQNGIVIGVTHDFHFNTLHHSIEPLAISPLNDYFSKITLKVDVQKANEVMALIEKTWKKHFPSALFDYGFLDQQIQAEYRAEERFSKIFLYFSILSLLIACLGLYGLISYSAWQKTKEVGIRKVFGATANGIVTMLSKDYLKLVLIACFIAMPIAWFIMDQWLKNFAYRISISWWMFTVSGLLVLFIALVTVSFQAIKAALANPVESLRNE